MTSLVLYKRPPWEDPHILSTELLDNRQGSRSVAFAFTVFFAGVYEISWHFPHRGILDFGIGESPRPQLYETREAQYLIPLNQMM